MRETKNLMVVDTVSGAYALQLDTVLHPYGFGIDSCHQPGRLSQRLAGDKRYDLILYPLSLKPGSVPDTLESSEPGLAQEVLKRLRQQKQTETIPVLFLLFQLERINSQQLGNLEKLMKWERVDLMLMPCDAKLLAIKCRNFIRLNHQTGGIAAVEFPAELSSAMKKVEVLSRREGEILNLVGEGLSNKEISKVLTLSEHSVRTHIYHIFSKLGIKRRSQAVLVDIYRRFNRSIS